ncbi:hypothetical protein Poli38472_002769 [Pythium oligandrum]|uniref:Lipase n=1 Tax=Pythium oligandrum TaxID=41045 RepID=A0A8K1CJ06_PYTOL|nr:hypothetical protein Poli38472_002769 [Pythium oligandrum]|eukprot:TMW63828.1 hypothetical protein Poli38472_002769 [Pythium oligandrum]
MAACVTINRRGAALTQGIVVTVHGLYGGRAPLLPMEACVRACDTHELAPFRYEPRHQTLATSGQALAEFLRTRKPHTTDDSVHFITYDYGALVLREAFRHVDWNQTRSKVIMLTPPNRGIKYYRSMRHHVGFAGYGGVAADELAQWTSEDLDTRLGKLPRRCYPLVIAGSLCLNPFNQGNYPNDGIVMVEETELPGEFRHDVLAGTHYTLPFHPQMLWRAMSFLNA